MSDYCNCIDCEEIDVSYEKLYDTKEFFRKRYLVVCEERDNLKKKLEQLKKKLEQLKKERSHHE